MTIQEELKSKFIIRNYTDCDDETIFCRVMLVIENGRISDYGKQGKGYCFVTTFADGMKIVCERFNKRDTFYVYKE